MKHRIVCKFVRGTALVANKNIGVEVIAEKSAIFRLKFTGHFSPA
jgi:hypothetical protein